MIPLVTLPLPRPLSITVPPMRGADIDAAARALHRYLKTGNLGAHDKSRDIVRETWGTGKANLTRAARKQAKLPSGFAYTASLDRVLIKTGAFDAKADDLRAEYIKSLVPPTPSMVHPHAAGWESTVCQGIHPTAGLEGNMALDWCAQGGTPVLSVVAAEVVKISGRNPSWGAENSIGIYGWSIHYVSFGGYRWFATHFGTLNNLYVGKKVRAGDVVGRVGSWPGDPGRSHTHLGCTSPHGSADAIRLIEKVAASPRVHVRA